MKTIILTLAIITTSIFNNSYANGNNPLDKILERSISFKNGEIAFSKNQSEFVRISFRINKEGHVTILDMNYSNEIIKNQILIQLKEMEIFGSFDINKVYNYNFSFIKE